MASAKVRMTESPGRATVSGESCRGNGGGEERRVRICGRKGRQLCADLGIEFADRLVVGRRRREVARRRCPICGDALAIASAAFLHVGIGWTLQIDEMIERRLGQRHESNDEAGRVVARRHRQVRTVEVRRAAQRHQQIVDERQVTHLLDGDAHHAFAPACDTVRLGRRQPIADSTLEAERRVEIRAEQIVLDLGGLGQQMNESFTARGHGGQRWQGKNAAALSASGRPLAPGLCRSNPRGWCRVVPEEGHDQDCIRGYEAKLIRGSR